MPDHGAESGAEGEVRRRSCVASSRSLVMVGFALLEMFRIGASGLS